MKSKPNIKKDLYSKLIDGYFTALVLVLIGLLMTMITPVVQLAFSRPGLLVYSLVILAVSVIMLERSIANRYGDESQARFGLVGGLLTWGVIDLTNQISARSVSSEMGTIIFLLLVLVAVVLWRQCPIGVKFYLATIITRWGGYLALVGLGFLANNGLIIPEIFFYTSYVIIALAVASVLWILLRSQRSTQRLWAALVLFECLVVIVSIIRGGMV